MYSWEIQNFLKERNYEVTKDEFVKVINQVDNPQVRNVTVDRKIVTTYRMQTSDGLDVTFTVKGM